MTSPPGGGSVTRPKRASIGPASRIEARIRAQSPGSSGLAWTPWRRCVRRWARSTRPWRRGARAARACVSTSRMRGMLSSSQGPSASSVAARMGSAAFLLPAGRMVPLRARPPRTLYRSGMAGSSTQRVPRRQAAWHLRLGARCRCLGNAASSAGHAGLGRADHGDLARHHRLRLRHHRRSWSPPSASPAPDSSRTCAARWPACRTTCSAP